jgi:two-component system, chemotaxis family, CheB/CheR fusion protein
MAPKNTSILVVGIGASAGGLEAFSQLLTHLPIDLGMAFVFVQHLDPTHPSLLANALAPNTRMPVREVVDGVTIKANHVYVIPPNNSMALLHGKLTLIPRDDIHKPHMAIDFFFRSLADEQESRAVGVILSGTGTDGTEGLRAINIAGGVVFAQDTIEAKFPQMPKSAIAAGVVHRTLTVKMIAEELTRLSRHSYLNSISSEKESVAGRDDFLRQIFVLTRLASGIDFSPYKRTTVMRRLSRRLALRQLDSLDDYVKLLQKDPGEALALSKDILIHVTEFFRYPEAFESLRRQVFPEIIQRHAKGTSIRIWVAGCSSGEEVYSIAITLVECFEAEQHKIPVQIFGSDVSEESIAKARSGLYPETLKDYVSHERLDRFFVRTENGYRIAKHIRDLCVFVKHDIAKDPPFAKLDLISCRNVFIYLGADLQKRMIQLFHRCLNQHGFLMLGRSESVAGLSQLFSIVDKPHKIFVKTGASPMVGSLNLLSPGVSYPGGSPPATNSHPKAATTELQRQADLLLLNRYAPPGVLVNEKMDIVQVRGKTGPFLELPSGQPNLNLLKLVRDPLLTDLSYLFGQSQKQQHVARKENVHIADGDRELGFHLEIDPLGDVAGNRYYWVLFEDSKPIDKPASGSAAKDSDNPELQTLREEMRAAQTILQSLADDRQRINEELTQANEELVSSNEELQSTNEELETAKEELQSANEELTTLNDELHGRNQDLNLANSDLVNLIASVDIPIVIISGDRKVRLFTPRAKTLMNLIPSDIGRPIDDIRLNVNLTDLDRHISEVLDTLTAKELDVQDKQGDWYRMQIRPYKTTENKLDGIVLSLIDISRLKATAGLAEAALGYIMSVVETIKVPVAVLNDKLGVVSANQSFFQTFGGTVNQIVGHPFFETYGGAWDTNDLKATLEASLIKDVDCALELRTEIPLGNKRTIVFSSSILHWKSHMPMLLLTLLDETSRSDLLLAAQTTRVDAEHANETKDRFLATLSHELRTPLLAISLQAEMLQMPEVTPTKARAAGEAIYRAAKAQEQIVSDLLSVSTILSGKLSLNLEPINLAAVIRTATETVRSATEVKSIALETDPEPISVWVWADALRLQQILWNLLTNAIKFTDPNGKIVVRLTRLGQQAVVRISDTGRGIAPEFLPIIFDKLRPGSSAFKDQITGLGLGLPIVRDLVHLHKGSIAVESPGEGMGTTFTLVFPVLVSSPNGIVAPAEQMPNVDRTNEEQQRLQNICVLVFEDDQKSRLILLDTLSKTGALVVIAESIAEAKILFNDFRPDVLICRISESIAGDSFIQWVRKHAPAAGGNTPAIALVSEWDNEAVLSELYQQHITQSATSHDFCSAIARVLKLT